MTRSLAEGPSAGGQRKFWAALLALAVLAAAVGSAALATALDPNRKTGASSIRAYTVPGPMDHYNPVVGDYSGTVAREATALVREELWPLGGVDVGVATTDPRESAQSDDVPLVVLSEPHYRQSAWEAPDSLTGYAGERASDFSPHDVAYEDEASFAVNGTCGLEEVGEIYQEYRLRGARVLAYLESPELRDRYPTMDSLAAESNFRSGGHYPAFMEELSLEVTFRLADYFSSDPRPDAALPLEYYIKFYNHYDGAWDTFRRETLDGSPGVDVYARGIYQTDYLGLTDEAFQFGAYFDPEDGISLLVRIGVKYSYGRGGYEELVVDRVGYSFASESEAIRLDCSGARSPGIPEEEWLEAPRLILELRTAAWEPDPADVVRTSTPSGFGRSDGVGLPEEDYDVGVEVPTAALGMYGPGDGMPNFDIFIYTAAPLEVEIDSVTVVYSHVTEVSCPTRWHANSTEEAVGGELRWEINLTASRRVINTTLELSADYDLEAVLSPYGENSLADFPQEGGRVIIDAYMASVLGYGTYQVVARSPNHLEGAAVVDARGDPINETDYSEPIRHRSILGNYASFQSEGRLGEMRVTFSVENYGYLFYSKVDSESANDTLGGFDGATALDGAAVGLVEVEWFWTNGRDGGFWPGEFVLRGVSDDPPFIKIFTPDQGDHVKEDALLYVAVIAARPDGVQFAAGENLTYRDMRPGFLKSYEGVSSILRDYTFFSTIPVGGLQHNTFQPVEVRAYDASNGKRSEESIAVKIDKRAVIAVDRIDQAFDDSPTLVNYTADSDIVRLSVYLDGELIGTFEGDDIGGHFVIPRVRSGTYFLELRAVDAVGNEGVEKTSFFVSQRNPSAWGTLVQWITDFFKIFWLVLLGTLAPLGAVAYARRGRPEGGRRIGEQLRGEGR
jgi:hypothetical protein